MRGWVLRGLRGGEVLGKRVGVLEMEEMAGWYGTNVRISVLSFLV